MGSSGGLTGDATIGGVLRVTPGATIEIGADTNLYRASANVLGTDDGLNVGANLRVFGSAIVDGQVAGIAGPAGQGLAGWTFDPVDIQGGTALTLAGTAHVMRFAANTSTISNIEIEITTAGSGLSNCFALIVNDAGAQIGSGAITADQSTPWQSTGRKVMALTAGQAVTPGAFYKVVLWANGTVPQLARAATGRPAALLNSGAAQPRFATANTGMTTVAPAGSFTLGAQTAIGTAFWAAVS